MKWLVFALLPQLVQCRPNIVLILTDDQDYELGSLDAMPKLRKLVGNQGMEFVNMFVTTPICCCSRSTIISGRYLHNHRAFNNTLEGGCAAPFWNDKMEPTAFPVYMKRAGYKTFYAGKYLNRYGEKHTGGPQHVPPGWDWWAALIGGNMFFNSWVSVNGTQHHYGQHDYFTHVIRDHAREFMKWIDKSQPFFMMLAPTAPHEPADSIPPYMRWFSDRKAPRTPHYGKYSPDKHWIVRQMPKELPDNIVDFVDDLFRKRWQSLQPVDDLIEEVIHKLDKKGVLDNTYVIFSSDNGFQLGQFNLPKGKNHLYEFDTRVPLLMRGPGVPKGTKSYKPVLNLDLGPTVLDLGDVPLPSHFDGMSFKHISVKSDDHWRSSFLVEYHGSGSGNPKAKCGPDLGDCVKGCICVDSRNNTFNCVRTVSHDENVAYCELEDDEHFVEFYDLNEDKFQLKNTANQLPPEKKRSYQDTLQKLKRCSGHECRLF